MEQIAKTDLIGPLILVEDGRGTYEIHRKDREGYEKTIAGPGLDETDALPVLVQEEKRMRG